MYMVFVNWLFDMMLFFLIIYVECWNFFIFVYIDGVCKCYYRLYVLVFVKM